MKQKRSKTAYMALKIYLEKTYDKLEWSFKQKALAKINCPNLLSSWIMECIKSVTFSLNINGSMSEAWNPQRGLRQGDLLRRPNPSLAQQVYCRVYLVFVLLYISFLD